MSLASSIRNEVAQEAGKPIQEDGLFRIYSMTKPIISVALMTLYEEGHFSLKDAVANFIPAFGKTKVYAGQGVLGLNLVAIVYRARLRRRLG